ncbi:MAG: Rnf-Nqr domain containing protein, partial [Bacillota bacterium]
SIGMSAADAIGMGLGFTIALTILGSIREIFGNGTIFGLGIFPESFQPAIIMILPPGGFLLLGLLLAFFNWNRDRKAKEGR